MPDQQLEILEEVLGKYIRVGDEFLFTCPRTNCNHHKPKLSINFKKNAYHCWVCGWSGRGLYRVIKDAASISQKIRWKNLDSTVEISDFGFSLFQEPKQEIKIELPSDFISLTRSKLPSYANPALEYLRTRGVGREDILRWRIGFSHSDRVYKERIIIPSFGYDGELNYFVGRAYVDYRYRYWNVQASKNIIFNHLDIDWDEDIHLVEGIFDAIKAGTNSIPILGSSLGENSLLLNELVKNAARVYIALDPDAREKQTKLINMLLEYGLEIYEILVPDGYDIGDLSKEDFQTLKKSSRRVSVSNKFEYNIKSKFVQMGI